MFGVDFSFVEYILLGENDIGSVMILREREDKSKNGNENIEREICVFVENRDEEDVIVKNEDIIMDQIEVINFIVVFDSSFCESELFNDVSFIMDIIDVVGLKIVEYFSF